MSARDAIEAIAKYSFLASNYPVILSLEIHCGVAQQDKLVAVLIEALGDRLVVARIDHEEGSDILKLPSPEDLKGKVLLKVRPSILILFAFVPDADRYQAKDLSIDVTTTFDQLAAALSADESGTSESSPGSDSDLKRGVFSFSILSSMCVAFLSEPLQSSMPFDVKCRRMDQCLRIQQTRLVLVRKVDPPRYLVRLLLNLASNHLYHLLYRAS